MVKRTLLVMSALALTARAVAAEPDYTPTWKVSVRATPPNGGHLVFGNVSTSDSRSSLFFSQKETAATFSFDSHSNPGYVLKQVTLNGQKLGSAPYVVSYNPARSYQSLVAVYAKRTCWITPAAGEGGVISPAFPVKVPYGGKKEFIVSPTRGFRIATVEAPGAEVINLAKGAKKVIWRNVSQDLDLQATFAPDFTIKPVITATPSVVYGLPKQVTLNAAKFSRIVPKANLTYSWVITPPAVRGVPGTPITASGATATFTVAVAGDYTVTLTATGPGGSAASVTKAVKAFTPAYVQAQKCLVCHYTNNASIDPIFKVSIGESYDASGHARNTERPVTCTTCHFNRPGMPHYAGDPLTSCGNCHVVNQDGLRDRHFEGHSLSFGDKDTIRDCGTCHNAHGATAGTQNVCTSCHTDAKFAQAPHVSDTTASYVNGRSSCAYCHPAPAGVLAEWRDSGHADTLSPAFNLYDFKMMNSCVKCHTTTGFVAYSTNRVTAAWGTPGDPLKEVIRCDACHTSPDGTVRNRIAYEATYSNMSTYSFPASGVSNLCIVCHSGTDSGSVIKYMSGDFSNMTFISPHLSAASGLVYGGSRTVAGGSGYQFDIPAALVSAIGYANGHYKHNTVGGTNGSCVGCHMTDSSKHNFMPISSASGTIQAITSTSCAGCHGLHLSRPMTVHDMSYMKLGMVSALDVLKFTLLSKGIYYKEAYPYFFQADQATPFTNWESVYAGKGRDVMGAAFNYALILHDPGAYSHNRPYTAALLRNSIDFLSDGLLNMNAESVISATNLTAEQKAAASYFFVSPSSKCTDCHSMHGGYGATATASAAATVDGADEVIVAPTTTDSSDCLGCHADMM